MAAAMAAAVVPDSTFLLVSSEAGFGTEFVLGDGSCPADGAAGSSGFSGRLTLMGCTRPSAELGAASGLRAQRGANKGHWLGKTGGGGSCGRHGWIAHRGALAAHGIGH
jgi:hypothetical protein